MNQGIPIAEPAAIVECLEGLSERPPASPEYVRFRVALLKAQTGVCETLTKARSRASLLRTEWSGKPPALGPEDVRFDGALLKRLLDGLAAALPEIAPRGGVLAHLAAASDEEPLLLEGLAREVVFGLGELFLGGLCKRLDVPREGLLFFSRALAAPFVSEAARRVKETAASEPPGGHGCCPYCGSVPGLAKLRREDGRRVLFCSLCGENWMVARTTCPFCANQGSLEVLSTGPGEPRWNETCARCTHYLKTTDERALPEDEPFIPLVEAVATLYLDVIAEQQGCAEGLPYSAPR